METRDAASLPLHIRALRSIGVHLRSPWPVVWLAGITLVLGFWGLSELTPDSTVSDRAYRSLQLLYLDANLPDTGTPAQLDVARFLAPLIIPYAALVALLAAVGVRAERVRMLLLGHRHVLIIGAGQRGALLAGRLRAQPNRFNVVVLEADNGSGIALSLRRAGIPVVFGDARAPSTLATVRAARAEQIVLLTGDDSVNLEVLASLRRCLRSAGAEVPIHVAIDDAVLWSDLYNLRFAQDDSPQDVEFFNLPDRSARLLRDAAYAESLGRRDGRTILIHGAAPDAARMVVHALRSVPVGRDPTVILEGSDAAAARHLLRIADPWVEGEETDAETGQGRARILLADGTTRMDEVDEAFVCGLREAAALSAATSIAMRTPEQTPIYVGLEDDETAAALEEVGVDLERFHAVPTVSHMLGPELFERSTIEAIARARHREYLRRGLERGDDPSKPAMRPWSQLRDEDRDGNYAYARDITELLWTLGARVGPLTGTEIGRGLPLSGDVRLYLEVREHNRWWRNKCANGFVYGPETSPPGATPKTNKFMKPWHALDDDAKSMDSDSIELLPRVLADLGYAMKLPSSTELERRVGPLLQRELNWRPDDPAQCGPEV